MSYCTLESQECTRGVPDEYRQWLGRLGHQFSFHIDRTYIALGHLATSSVVWKPR